MFPIFDIAEDLPRPSEQAGAENKFWYMDPCHGRTLFKAGRPNTGENWAERLACELARQLGLPRAVLRAGLAGRGAGRDLAGLRAGGWCPDSWHRPDCACISSANARGEPRIAGTSACLEARAGSTSAVVCGRARLASRFRTVCRRQHAAGRIRRLSPVRRMDCESGPPWRELGRRARLAPARRLSRARVRPRRGDGQESAGQRAGGAYANEGPWT